MKRKTIVGYQVRNKSNGGIRSWSSSFSQCKANCPFGCAVWSTRMKTYGIKLMLFWMSPFRKIQYNKYSSVVNFFHLHVGWEVMRKEVPYKIVYEPEEKPSKGN